MSINSANDISKMWSARATYYGDDHKLMDEMIGVYFGSLPSQYDEFFHDEMHVHLINMIRLSWDDLANLSGKEFPIYVAPDSNKTTAKDRAEKLEKVAYGWNEAGRMAGGVSMKTLMKVLMWWLVGTANAVAVVLPDFKHQSPYFTFRDPRTFYPPVGWSPFTQASADDSLFAYQMSVAELCARYPESASILEEKFLRRGYQKNASADTTHVWVGEYYSDDVWYVATIGEDNVVVLKEASILDKGFPGIDPVVPMGMYSPNGAKGRSLFADQISIQAAMARMFSAKLDYYDRTLYPLIFTTPLAHKNIRIGPYAINEFDTTTNPNMRPLLQTVQPANAIDADQSMSFSIGLSRMLNRNPEQFQGAGDANSSKALSSLKEGVTQTVREMIWPPAIEAIPLLYEKAARMDVKLWGTTRKFAAGSRKNTPFTVPYTPRATLLGREHTFRVEKGLGLAGYQDTLELMQLVQAEMIPLDDALEQGEWSRDPQDMKRAIQGDRSEKLIWASLNARAAQDPATPGALKPGAMAKIRRLQQEHDMDLFDAIEKLEASGELYQEAPPPPDLSALMGGMPPGGPPGGAVPPGMVPNMSAIRGGR